ncbi:CoA pyrophosphatase [Rhodococcus sp. BP-252]|uniref:Coenzyme A pyrophosphatase n=1 Tax=Rhodococcoides kyotonense TaxID=398843 RepID=A0A177Y875_9NOCA|nr:MULTISPECIES: CoA pyrophosphatase [Rhodococcus]MBY6410166.1 CoA pyrophosphatase [Rhodococcus sp. BP-320]MBY6415135.1 CoA pyrophosphatase [Rhodococcus sp. BP-321]MBY6421458.1 CoA pyrophosphatase [Rhodococcus sp. BP-324]MBY6425557.1 CoA pyrophosphatase [Rhodococcus sp. BP-323]MBY6430031.1 CoA pyrophosphatase [Rhodococcus sp. BP-322]
MTANTADASGAGEPPDYRLERSDVVAALSSFVPTTVPARAKRAASVALAIGGTPGHRRLLLTKRPSRLRAHPGQFALPGGSVDPGESSVEACLRELHEELGLRADQDAVLGRLDDYETRSGYVITPFVVWVGDRLAELKPSPDEVAIVYEVGVSEIDIDPRFVTIEQSERPVIQWPFRESLVHAPTGAVVHQFREVVLRGRHTRVADFEQPVFAWR